MNEEQFSILIRKLEEIRCGIVKDETTEESMINAEKLRSAFFNILQRKTGWGRNELKIAFDAAIESTLEGD